MNKEKDRRGSAGAARGAPRAALALLALLSLACNCTLAAGAPERANVSHLEHWVDLWMPTISPDGRQVALITSRAKYATNEYVLQLVIVDVASGVAETVNPPPTYPHLPSWSPRGDRLAWLEAAEGGRYHIVVRRMGDPAPAAIIATARGPYESAGPSGMSRYAWSPDGSAIAYLSADEPAEATGSERFNRSFEVIEGNYLAATSPSPAHVWVVASDGTGARRLTSGSENARSVSWSANGRSILYVAQPRAVSGEFRGLSMRESSLKRVDLATLETGLILPSPAKLQSAPSLARRADQMAYLTFNWADPWTFPRELVVASPSGGQPRNLTRRLDRDIDEFVWLPDSRHLLISGPDRDRQALWLQPVEGDARRLDTDSLLQVSGLSVSRAGAVAFVGSDAVSPPELFVMSSTHARPKRVTQFNAPLAALALGHTETLTWRSEAFEPTGVVILPPGFDAARRYPLVLNIHGGPNATSTGAFSLFDQILAAQGWVVFKPNYRGSNSHGRAFQGALVGDMAAGPGRDILAGIEALKQRAYIDPDRVALSGWSYGGYLSAWLLGQRKHWSSAVIGVPITNFLDYYNLSCCNVWMDGVLGGSPWVGDNLASYWRQSPLPHLQGVKTPTLILAHSGDAVVPATQSYALYHALRDNGAPVSFIMYPIGGHSLASDPVHERDKYRRWIAWISQHF